ncbi:hypothetical protein MPER_07680 [Moniliophthora perniciosa FA553]|nr:hypothetical protein MPER_07680 [Moniliophthora perniciosa FA553]
MASTSAPLKTIEERIMDAWYQEKANNNCDSDDESDSDSDSSSIVLSASVSQTYTYKDNNNEVDIGGSHELVGASEPRAFSDRFGPPTSRNSQMVFWTRIRRRCRGVA